MSSTNYATWSEFTSIGGSPSTDDGAGTEQSNPIVLMDNSGTTDAFFGYAGLNTVFGLEIPQFQAAGIYTTTIVYTLVISP